MKHFKVSCVADPRDVLNVKCDKKIDLIESICKEIATRLSDCETVVLSKDFNSFEFILTTDVESAADAIKNAAKAVSEQLLIKEVNISVSEVSDKAVNDLTGTPSSNSEGAAAGEKDENGETKPEVEKQDEKEQSVSAYESILSLVGMDEFKTWAGEIEHFVESCPSKEILQRILLSMSYVVSIDSGNGCSTLLECMGNLLVSRLEKSRLILSEITVDPDPDRGNFEAVRREIYSIDKNEKLYLYALHLDKAQDLMKTEQWSEFLNLCRAKNDAAVFVFVVPVLEDIALSEIYRNINDLLPNKVIRIAPFSSDDYICFFEKFFAKFNMKVDISAHEPFLDKLAEEKNDGKFHGINTVDKVCEEILYHKFKNSDAGAENDCITQKDILPVLDGQFDAEDNVSGYELLDNLVSLDGVKKKIREIVESIKLNKKLEPNKPQSMHMMFCGAPGTGKTEVARIIGKIFREENLLSRGGFYEVTRKDLVGTYIGHTAPKTAAVCRNAYGSVLFIDEAYSLDGGSHRDYGKEAISTLIAEMENNRGRLIVILAGYTQELERLFDLNPGLRDRIPYRLNFENYSRDELREIFFKKIPKKFTFNEEFKEAVEKYFAGLNEDLLGDENFSNARFVRNLAERVFSKAAMRLRADKNDDDAIELIASDFELAIADTEFKALNEKKKGSIGFQFS